MYYYQFNIGDYASHTRHLNMFEDLAYRRLLDWYYLNEKPIPLENPARCIGMNERSTDVEQVLNEFFLKTEKGWVNKRTDKEICDYHKKQKCASSAGKKSAEARKANKTKAHEQTFNDRSTTVQPTNNQEPLTKNQEPIINIAPTALVETNVSNVIDHPKKDQIPYQEIVDLYHRILPMCPQVFKLSDKRKKQIRARWLNELSNLDLWEQFFTDVSRSKFLTGRAQAVNGRKVFTADIEWLTNESNLIKIAEGKYDN